MYRWSVKDVWVLSELTLIVDDQNALERTLVDLEAERITIESAIDRLRATVSRRLPDTCADERARCRTAVSSSLHFLPTRTGLNS